MTKEVILTLLLSVSIALCQGREVCTFTEELETEGNQNDWQGFKTVANLQRCKEFCSAVTECVAAEYSRRTGSCYLYKGPTTLRYNKEHVFMVKKCREITTAQGTSTIEEITTSALTSRKDDTDPSTTTETTTATTDISTTTVTTTTTSSTTTTSTTVTTPTTTTTTTLNTSSNLDVIKMMMTNALTPDETRTRRAVSTETISKMLTTERIRTPSRKKKHRMPPSLAIKMQRKWFVSRDKPTTSEYTTPEPSTSTTKQATTASTTVKTRKQRKLYPWTSTPEYKKSTHYSKTSFPDTSLTKSPTFEYTTPLPRFKPERRKQTHTIQASKTIDLKITDSKEGVNIKADNSTTAQTLVSVSMKTSSYKPVPFGKTRPRYFNRVDTPTAIRGVSSIGRRCIGYYCPRAVLIPMIVHVPVMRPQVKSHQPRAGLHHPLRFHIRTRLRFRPYMWTPYRNQYRVRAPYTYNSRRYVPYGYGAFPPQHAPVAQYGRQTIPWANNFRRASLRAPKTHQVAVIPGKRYQPTATRRRVYKQPYEYKPKVSTTQKPAPLKKSDAEIGENRNVNDQAKQHNQQSVSGSKSRSSTENTPQNDQQWELKSHYNTYTLRLKLPVPISGYKKCYQRQQLPTPPKILVVAFNTDGSFSAKALPVSYPRRVCIFIKPGKIYPELHLPSPLVLFTGTSFAKDANELGKIYNATAPKAEYDVKSLQQTSSVFNYISVYNRSPVFRQVKIPISFARAMVSFDMARMGFIYRFTVRLPKALKSQNLVVEDEIQSDIPFLKISPKPFVRGS